MSLYYLRQLAGQFPWAIILVAAWLNFRQSRRWSERLQVAGAAIIVLLVLYGVVLFDPYIGVVKNPRTLSSGASMALMIPASICGLVGLAAFLAGYLAQSIRDAQPSSRVPPSARGL